MNARRRFYIGGFGALMPVMVSLLAIDIGAMLNGWTVGNIVGTLIRYVILFMIGGFVAYLHEDEIKPFKLFEIGIAAPALITSLITAQGVSGGGDSDEAVTGSVSFSIISAAYAADQDENKSSFFSDLIRGATGAVYSRTLKKKPAAEKKTAAKTKPEKAPAPHPQSGNDLPGPIDSDSLKLRSVLKPGPVAPVDIAEQIQLIDRQLGHIKAQMEASQTTVDQLERQYQQKQALRRALMSRLTE